MLNHIIDLTELSTTSRNSKKVCYLFAPILLIKFNFDTNLLRCSCVRFVAQRIVSIERQCYWCSPKRWRRGAGTLQKTSCRCLKNRKTQGERQEALDLLFRVFFWSFVVARTLNGKRKEAISHYCYTEQRPIQTKKVRGICDASNTISGTPASTFFPYRRIPPPLPSFLEFGFKSHFSPPRSTGRQIRLFYNFRRVR